MKRNRNDVIAEIKTALDEARIRANAYTNITVKQYDYWRAIAAIAAYDGALAMFERGTENEIPDMAVKAVADFEYVRDNDVTEMTIAFTDGRRDALASVAEWMIDR